jgi:hypothetical protein
MGSRHFSLGILYGTPPDNIKSVILESQKRWGARNERICDNDINLVTKILGENTELLHSSEKTSSICRSNPLGLSPNEFNIHIAQKMRKKVRGEYLKSLGIPTSDIDNDILIGNFGRIHTQKGSRFSHISN